jgi:hypothetical protein
LNDIEHDLKTLIIFFLQFFYRCCKFSVRLHHLRNATTPSFCLSDITVSGVGQEEGEKNPGTQALGIKHLHWRSLAAIIPGSFVRTCRRDFHHSGWRFHRVMSKMKDL